jgi:hypothetical protein
VRKGSTNQIATKDDIELMYYDRKNIVPEYEIHANIAMDSLGTTSGGGKCEVHFHMTLENSGRRPVSINQILFKLDFEYTDFTTSHSVLNFISKPSTPIIVQSQEMVLAFFDFQSVELFRDQSLHGRRDLREALEYATKTNLTSIVFNVFFSNGRTITVKPFFTEHKGVK